MPRNVTLPGKQRGISVIELPVIVLVLMVLIVFAVKINHGLSTKAQLDRLAYSLASVVTSDRLGISLAGSQDAVTPQLAESLQQVATRHFEPLAASSSVEVGVFLEQLKFDDTGKVALTRDTSAGASCLPKNELLQLQGLAPVGTVEGVNKGQRADLFQVTVCLKRVPSLSGELSKVLTKDFVERYFTSSAVLIGRQL